MLVRASLLRVSNSCHIHMPFFIHSPSSTHQIKRMNQRIFDHCSPFWLSFCSHRLSVFRMISLVVYLFSGLHVHVVLCLVFSSSHGSIVDSPFLSRRGSFIFVVSSLLLMPVTSSSSSLFHSISFIPESQDTRDPASSSTRELYIQA